MLSEAGLKQLLIQPFHNGFFGAPFLKKVFNRKVIPIPLKVPIPFTHHLFAIAFKYLSVQESVFEMYVEVPDMLNATSHINKLP